ncbi:helix-turn-helix domain-containing protein [Pseudonocardia sp. T1-2H]|uniref:helix-turn-helix domain-containing protein n=1 Tax=Pseudonocardia sp. T1-2H TaxID=3128899 RepID=UPI00310100E0
MNDTPQVPPLCLVLTIEEAAERLRIGRTLMYALVSAGEVESVRIGRLRRIPADALTTYVQSLRGEVA